ncbi:flavin reductase [Leptolyngbya sp. KIOST-1]|uniref:flavin reductase n=1 Tax=Leptolyngbya sp. KIOST-1 TaxID=1229172 RepID=UPI00055A35C9|nr:flavin reductase [Leptolyngbya sp. KIOST-1]
MTSSSPTTPVSLPTAARPRDVQVAELGAGAWVLRSRTWDRLKFEVEYSRQRGTTANAYLIRGDRSALIDPPGESFTAIFLAALQQHIDLSALDYIVLGHINANRLATLRRLQALAPQAQILCSRPAARWLQGTDLGQLTLHPVRSGDDLDLGQEHRLRFLAVPTPRWPDGLCTYDAADQVLYSDKLFGAHLCADALWDEQWRQLEADRSHYFDCLHRSQTRQVATALEQFQPLALKTIAPGHGPLVRYSLSRIMQDYRQWCQQQGGQSPRVALLYASAYGSTAELAAAIAQGLTDAGVAVELVNCEQSDPAALIDSLARCDGVILGSPTLGGHAPVQMQTALGLVLETLPKTKPVGVFGSYGWSGEAIDWLVQKLRDANFTFGFEPLRVRFSPDADAIEACHSAAAQFVQRLRKRQQRQARKPTLGEAQGDRTQQAQGHIVGALCVVTIPGQGRPRGVLTASVTQASFHPPGLMLALPQGSFGPLSPGTPFGLNILQEGRSVRRHFSTQRFTTAAFDHLPFSLAENGCARLDDALACLQCTVLESMPLGDRTLIYATVERGELLTDGVPALGA